MIIDTLQNAATYAPFHPLFAKAFAFLNDPATASLPAGRHDLQGSDLFALVQAYDSRLPENCALETHKTYIDIQFLLSGSEYIGYAPLTPALTEKTPYNPESDIAFFNGIGTPLPLTPGTFAILYPQDAHAPGICDGEPGPIRKIVIKIAVNPA